MNINRDNYEAYFLLYTDNELSPAEQAMVEDFLLANADLQDEMQRFQQVIVRPEKIIFQDKKSLLKPEPADAALQQQLLLLLDNELPAKQAGYTRSLVQYDEQIKKEWELLQQTKLPAADTIVFTGKASLYKKEREKVIAFKWWKLAVAAMLTGFGLWGAASLFKSNPPLPAAETAKRYDGIKPVEKPAVVNASAQNNVPDIIIEKTIVAASKEDKAGTRAELKKTTSNKPVQPTLPQKENNIVQQKADNNLPPPVLENVNNSSGNNNELANVQPGNKNDKSSNQNNNELKTAVYAANTTFEDDNTNKKNFASFDNDGEDDNKSKKTKLAGFLKKIKRTIERNANIKAGGDNVRIANISFAMQ